MFSGMNALKVLLALLVMSGCALASVNADSMLLMAPEIPLKKCRYMRSHSLFQAQCKDKKLVDIPANLQSGIEVLDAGENRIRELRNDSLSRYTSLRFLYLQDNFLTTIAENAFAPTYYLEVLDVSTNALSELPKNFFQMQYLRNLYLNTNKFTDAVFNVSSVRSPIRKLHVSENKLTRLPQLSPLASVEVLNVSHNLIDRISSEDIAPLCSLQILDLTGNPIKFNESNCDCYEFKEWIVFRKIELVDPVNCEPTMRNNCFGTGFSNRTMELYGGCVTNLQNQAEARKARSTWIWIASCIGGFMACIFVTLCCMHKRNKSKRQRLKEKEILAANNANTEQLLNKDINHEQS